MDEIQRKRILFESYTRCENIGFRKDEGSFLVQSEKIIKESIEKNRYIIKIAEPLMDTLYHAISIMAKRYVVVLTDKNGLVIKLVTGSHIIPNIKCFNFSLYVSCSEYDVGTNGIGTAIANNIPFAVYGDEHYCKRHTPWITVGAPIHNESKEIIGCVGCCGDMPDIHPHTLGMIIASAQSIENMIILDKTAEKLTLYANYLESSTNSLEEGIVSFNTSGEVSIINNKAKDIFGYEEVKDINGKDVFSEDRFEKMIANELLLDGNEISIRTRKGKIRIFVNTNTIYNSEGKITGVIAVIRDKSTIHTLTNRITGAYARFTFSDIIGNSPKLNEVLQLGLKASSSSSNVLILGESGTGKELIVQAIHNASSRKNNPFIALNCGAIPKDLLESELFGYEEGTFTGGKQGGKPGKFEVASGGTLFLDEIGDMPVNMQTSLLRVLQDGFVTRLGSGKSIPIDVRIIAATNKNLKEQIEDGMFRLDLFYRLNIITLEMPSLRERKEDIPILVNYFIRKLSKKIGKRITSLEEDFMEELINYQWPGNVRELENVIERCINICDENLPLHKGLLPKEIARSTEELDYNEYLMCSLEDMEKKHILNILKALDGNKTKASEILSIDRSTLYKKIKKFNIEA